MRILAENTCFSSRIFLEKFQNLVLKHYKQLVIVVWFTETSSEIEEVLNNHLQTI